MRSKTLYTINISVLDLAMVPEKGSAEETFANSAIIAQHAEQWGYTRYWLAEHHNMEGIASTATAVLIGHIASKTNTLRVGSGGIMLPNHTPLVVAEQFGTLATLFPGRIDLGLGRAPGTDQLTAMALRRNADTSSDFPLHVQELQQYLSADNVTSRVRAFPGEGLDIPIWILGSSTDSAHLAAALGLPYAFASHFAPAMLMQAIAIYRREFQPSEHLSEPFVMACVNVIAADTDTEALHLATSFKRLFLGILTGNRKKLSPPVDPEGLFDYTEEAALQQMIKYSFVGGPEKIDKELQEFIHLTNVDEIMITSPIYDHHARLHSYEIVAELHSTKIPI
jgi:luciferase family oxidoreductase group 1